MRRRLLSVAVGLGLLGATGACTASDASNPASGTVAPSSQPAATPADSEEAQFVAYRDDVPPPSTAPDAAARGAAFQQRLAAWCRASTARPAPGDETELRVDATCPRRTADWMVVRDLGDAPAAAGS